MSGNGLVEQFMVGGVERRFVPAELRVDGEGRIEGYGAVFDEWSVDMGFFREKVRRGAFTKTIGEADIRSLFNHDMNYVLGRNRSGTLELSEDSRGLHFRVSPPETTWAKDLLVSVRRGDVSQASFGFDALRDNWEYGEDDLQERELIEVRLYDVGPVTFPAYPQTEVSARSLAGGLVQRLRFSGADPEVIEGLIEELRGLVSTAPAEDGHPVEEEGSRYQIGLMRRRLELLEIC